MLTFSDKVVLREGAIDEPQHPVVTRHSHSSSGGFTLIVDPSAWTTLLRLLLPLVYSVGVGVGVGVSVGVSFGVSAGVSGSI